MAGATSTQVVNEALNYIGYDGPAVSGVAPNFDSSNPGQIAQNVYAAAVAAAGRMNNWDFPRTFARLGLSGNNAPWPWAYEYDYPANCVEIWQITPLSGPSDPNNPIPVTWARGIAQVSNVQSSVIWTDQQYACAFFNGNPLEATWDALFRALVVRYLASAFAMANLGKPDVAQSYFDSVGGMLQIGAARTDT
jgi:hypothetical protein